MSGKLSLCSVFLGLFIISGCNTTHEVAVQPVEIKPIHITIDVNVRMKEALDDFFEEIEAIDEKEEISR